MPVFKDKNGKEWTVSLDAPTISELRKEVELDFGAMDGKAFELMEADPVLLVNSLWVICRSQANGMKDVDFGRALVGDAIEHATKALSDAWHDFFPAGKRSLLRSLSEKQAAVTEKATALALAKINSQGLEDKLLAAMQARMDREMQEALTRLKGATNSPESSAPVPTD